MDKDEVFVLSNGREISIDAAIGDLGRVEKFLLDYVNWTPREDDEEADGLLADIGDVRHLLRLLANRV